MIWNLYKKRVAQKTAEGICDLIGNKIAEKIASASNKSRNAYKIREESDKAHEIPKTIYI